MNNKIKSKMKKEFVSYELAVKLKALGFDEPCIYHFKKNNECENSFIFTFEMTTPFGKNHNILESRISSPLFQQAFRWFREKHHLTSWIYTSQMSKFYYTILYGRYVKSHESSNTYEEAELACLNKLIEIVQGGQDEKVL